MPASESDLEIFARLMDPERAKRLTQRIWMVAELGILVRVDPELSEQIARLGVDHKLSTYDAGYAAGAPRLGVTPAGSTIATWSAPDSPSSQPR